MMKMAELRAYNVAEGMMVDETLAALTGQRLGPVPPGGERARGLMEGVTVRIWIRGRRSAPKNAMEAKPYG